MQLIRLQTISLKSIHFYPYVDYRIHNPTLHSDGRKDIHMLGTKFINPIGIFITALLSTYFTIVGDVSAAPLTGKVDEVHQRFNQTAKSIDTRIRMVLTECQGVTCSYFVTGNLAAIGYSQQDASDQLDNFILIYASGSDSTNMILSMGILMITYSPSAAKDERGAALNQLSAGLQSGIKETSVILGKSRYKLSNLGSMGLWFTVKGR